MPIANGLALASKMRKEDRVTVAYFGDGAANIGAFHEALNMASIWKLPVIFVCQNNRYAEHTKFSKGTAIDQVARRAAAYSMPGVHVDGNNPVEVYHAAREAVERARTGGGPTLIEAMTFRFFGHLMGDTDAYMDKGEKEAWMSKDPVPAFRAKLIADGFTTEEELATIEAEIKADIDEAAEFALSSPFPDLSELRADVYKYEVVA
jgi:TPP-dependent pyruvate/acetoin dehydrogenase alpha subunit